MNLSQPRITSGQGFRRWQKVLETSTRPDAKFLPEERSTRSKANFPPEAGNFIDKH